ncbi:hypothetical protein OG21DRAFT_648480 [Imleria badia]|nr:hypothetical protein OG21DRAFT_648480 [Imleria badia]
MVYPWILPPPHALTCIPLELHSQSKSSTSDLFKYYPSISELELPTDIPIANYVLPSHTSLRDASGQLVYGAPVQNRPWEWIESLLVGELAMEEDTYRWQEGPFKNVSSLSLELFAARRTGEHIPRPNLIRDTTTKHDDDESNMRLEGDVRSFEDGLSAQCVYRRVWRETKLEAYRDGQVDGGGLSRIEVGVEKSVSRVICQIEGSLQGTVSSVRQSPGSDDEVETIEGPLPTKADVKKSKSVKARGKKR